MALISCLPPTGSPPKAILHIEVRVRSDGDNIITRTDIVREDVTEWLRDNFVVLNLGQELHALEADLKEPHAQVLESIKVVECTGGEIKSGIYRLENVELDVQAYQLRGTVESECPQPQNAWDSGKGEWENPQARVIPLPTKDFDGIWESLLFDQPIPSTLLRALSRMLTLSSHRLNTWTTSWNRLVLLWGPPGTGKTSLCHALAQKLAIRLGKHFPQSKLVEIQAPSLGSKYFNESGKLVSKMFDNIESMLLEEEDTLVCVLIDEVETLTARREQALSGNEPLDGMRAVNALLTGLDRLRHHPNVIILCTSNLIGVLDGAFVDRVDIKQFVPRPSAPVIYEIYRSCLENLSQCGIIKGLTFDIVQLDPEDPKTPLQYMEHHADSLTIPSHDEMLISYQIFPNSIPKRLADVADASVGLSGRCLRKLPVLSLALHLPDTNCLVHDVLTVLEKGVVEAQCANVEAAAKPVAEVCIRQIG